MNELPQNISNNFFSQLSNMPKLNKRRSLGYVYARKRWYERRDSSESESASEGEAMVQDHDDDVKSIEEG